MNQTPAHGSLATRLAALQQGLAAPLVMIEGGIAPYATLTPSASGSRHKALRTDKKQAPEHAALLIGASKSQPIELLEEAITLGLADFGENKVQEAQGKWPALKARHPNVCLHLIGPLQSNKAEDAVALFDVIHTIDRVKIADALAAACQKLGYSLHGASVGAMAAPSREQREARGLEAKRREAQPTGSGGETPPVLKAPPKFLIQVNTGEEPQKAGVAPREVASLLAHCRGLGLDVVGLMCVPPEGENPAPHFALLAKMAGELGLRELSMGMSGDYETALRLGATMIRVGTALFGARDR